MTDREIESGFELVLDNRKKILIFAVIIAVCGCFFVWGFIAGKRQGMQLGAVADIDTPTAAQVDGTVIPAEQLKEGDTEVPPLEEDAVQQDLDWYQSVNRKGGDPESLQPPRASETAKETVRVSSSGSDVHSAAATYSVQVGAFKQRPEAEAHARNVRSRGFDSRVEPPESSGKLYLVKVGKFDTRAEAVAVQLRLRNNGFSCFVKTN